MSKKYKCIREYPYGPPIGTIISDFDSREQINSVIGYPEFWEEIKEPEFQILAAKTSVKVSLTVENTSTEIYKVLRLSDNETFSIGDKCNLSNGNGNRNPILRFEVRNENWGLEKYRNKDRIVVFLETMHKTEWGPIELDSLVRSKEPLFVTEDKIEIFEGDKYLEVVLIGSRYNIREMLANSTSNPCKDYCITFSAGKTAKDWIDLNKPKYSLQDIFNAKSEGSKFPTHFAIDFDKLNK